MNVLAGLVLSLVVPAPVSADTAPPTEYEPVYEAFASLTPRSDKIAVVRALTLERDAARIVLEEGTLYLLSPVAGRTVGAVFVGTGRLTLTPPTRVEREQLARLYDAPSLDRPFRELVLIFADTTLAELEARLTFEGGAASRDAVGAVEEALKYLVDRKSKAVHPAIMIALLNGHHNDLFYAHLAEKRGDPLIFEIDPYRVEAVSLSRRAKWDRFAHDAEVVCQFQRREEYAADGDPELEQRDLVQVTHYRIESTIDEKLGFSAAADVVVRGEAASSRWAQFWLFEKLELDSARWGDGSRATVFRGKEAPLVWVRFDPPLAAGESRTLRLVYHGELFQRWRDQCREQCPLCSCDEMPGRLEDWIFLRSSIGWYPAHNPRVPALFDLTYRVPARWVLASIGTRVAVEEANDVRTTRWITDRPVRNASFNFGWFSEYAMDLPGIPRATVLMAERAHRDLPTRFLSGAGTKHQVGADVANSLRFFHDVFGQPLTERFWATEIPYGHGEAFPGLVHLSWWTFHEKRDEGTDELFRAHEMAHQWWGIGVDYRTYRDRWLSEGFSDFAAVWYLETVLNQRDKARRHLADWRKAILKRRDKVGPISLGHRNLMSTAPDDYQLVVYQKGAWVLHMLRSLMTDPATGSDTYFRNMVRDFYTTQRGTRASTRDFQRTVEQHIGMDMTWFFDQWVRGTAIPTYRFAYTARQDDAGHVVRVRIEQQDVPEDFKMFVPIHVTLANGDTARFQLLVSGEQVVTDLPPLPAAPNDVVFNPDESVLAEVKTVKW